MDPTFSMSTLNCTQRLPDRNLHKCKNDRQIISKCKFFKLNYPVILWFQDISSLRGWRLCRRSAILCNDGQQLRCFFVDVEWKRQQQLLHCACWWNDTWSKSIAWITSNNLVGKLLKSFIWWGLGFLREISENFVECFLGASITRRITRKPVHEAFLRSTFP